MRDMPDHVQDEWLRCGPQYCQNSREKFEAATERLFPPERLGLLSRLVSFLKSLGR